MEKPKKEDYGWQDGGIWDETGWLLEGGEDAYLEALSRYDENEKLSKFMQDNGLGDEDMINDITYPTS